MNASQGSMIAEKIEPSLQALSCAARQAEAGGAWNKAAEHWREVRERFPETPAGYYAGAECLRQQGQLSDAAAVLSLGLQRFPEDEWMAVEHAWLLFHMGDFSRAVRDCRDIRRRYPENLGGYLAGALASRHLTQFEEAEEVYRDAFRHFPDTLDLLLNFAWCAQERQAPEAVARWQNVIKRFPEVAEGHLRLGLLLIDRGCFDEADGVLATAVARFPDSEEAMCSYALAAHTRRDWSQALKRWEAVLHAFQNSREPRRRAAEVLNELGRFGEAIQVLEPALRMFPEDQDIAVLHGWLATRRRDFAEAERAWRDVRARFPQNQEGYRGYAWALKDAGRLDDAQALLEEAARLFPDDAEIALDMAAAQAGSAAHREDWPRVLKLWHTAQARFPDNPRGYVGLGQALRDAGELEPSAQTLSSAVSRFPGVPEAEVQLALTLSAQRRWPAALALWESLRQRYPSHTQVRWGIVEVLDQATIDRAAGVGEPFEIPESLLSVEFEKSPPVQGLAARPAGQGVE